MEFFKTLLNGLKTWVKRLIEQNRADWNAAPGEDGYVKNRPFYEETVDISKTLYDGEAQFQFVSTANAGEFNVRTPPGINYPFSTGNVIRVVIDGAEYIFDDHTPRDSQFGFPRIDDVGFAAYGDDLGGQLEIVLFNTSANFTANVKVEVIQETVVKTLDSKFIDPSIPRGINVSGDLQLYNGDDGTVTILYNTPVPTGFARSVAINGKTKMADIDGKITLGISSGTTEYEDGVTNLATGEIYLQYE